LNILSIDASCNACTAAIVAGDKLVAQLVINNKKTHSEKLMPMIENMLSASEFSLSDIDLIAVANGPGSFTGVRIGVATAQGLAHSLGIPCVGVSTLEALAGNMFGFDGIICPILNARREQVYTAQFQWKNGELLQGMEDSNIMLAELLERLETERNSVIFLGDGIFEFRAEIEGKLGDQAVFAPPQLNMNLAGSVAYRAQEYIRKNGDVPIDNIVVPNYLRLSQAERELEEKNA